LTLVVLSVLHGGMLRGEMGVVEAHAQYNSCDLRSVRRSYEGLIPRNLPLSKEVSHASATRHTGVATTPGASA
jgi:hypothetical protein